MIIKMEIDKLPFTYCDDEINENLFVSVISVKPKTPSIPIRWVTYNKKLILTAENPGDRLEKPIFLALLLTDFIPGFRISSAILPPVPKKVRGALRG